MRLVRYQTGGSHFPRREDGRRIPLPHPVWRGPELFVGAGCVPARCLTYDANCLPIPFGNGSIRLHPKASPMALGTKRRLAKP